MPRDAYITTPRHATAVNAVREGDNVKLEGLALVFDDGAERRNLNGQFFNAKTDFGFHAKGGAMTVGSLFNHGVPLDFEDDGAVFLANQVLGASDLKRSEDEGGWVAELVMPIREDWQKQVAELAEEGMMGWSTSTAPHTMKQERNGYVSQWWIIENALTPIPAEPKTEAIVTLNSWRRSFRNKTANTNSNSQILGQLQRTAR